MEKLTSSVLRTSDLLGYDLEAPISLTELQKLIMEERGWSARLVFFFSSRVCVLCYIISVKAFILFKQFRPNQVF